MRISHVNSENETISVEGRMLHGTVPVQVIVIHDDPPPQGTGALAPMLLDRGTVQWLRHVLEPGYIFDQAGDPL